MDMPSACVSIWFVPLSGHVRSWGTLEVDSWDLISDRQSSGLLFQSFILSRTFFPLGVHHPGTHKLFKQLSLRSTVLSHPSPLLPLLFQCCYLISLDKVSPRIPGWPWTRDPPTSASPPFSRVGVIGMHWYVQLESCSQQFPSFIACPVDSSRPSPLVRVYSFEKFLFLGIFFSR